MNVKQEISIKKVTADAQAYFGKGFFCCESVIASIVDNFELDVPREVIAMSSGMAGGAGRNGCICGAVNSGIMALGLFFGRTEPGDPKAEKCVALVKEFYSSFQEMSGKTGVCCRVLTKGMDMKAGEHKEQCLRFVGFCAGKVAEIVIRELGLTNLDEQQ